MQTSLLPITMCNEIDKKCRCFLWGSVGPSRKALLIAWDDICKGRKAGDLGLRYARKQNIAFMVKLWWGLVHRRDALWVKFLREKYKCGDDVIPNVEKRREESQVWKGIKFAWEETLKGISWKVGDGCYTRFWEDMWLPNLSKLGCYSYGTIEESQRDLEVADYLTVTRDWNWSLLRDILPGPILRCLEQVRRTMNRSVQDMRIWSLSNHGVFTVKSAYSHLCLHGRCGPHRGVRIFFGYVGEADFLLIYLELSGGVHCGLCSGV